MDWLDPSRFIPEVGVLTVVGFFSLKAINIFKDIVNTMERKNQKSFNKLSKAIDRNTESNKELLMASKEQHDFMKNLNGRLVRATKNTIKERKSEDT